MPNFVAEFTIISLTIFSQYAIMVLSRDSLFSIETKLIKRPKPCKSHFLPQGVTLFTVLQIAATAIYLMMKGTHHEEAAFPSRFLSRFLRAAASVGYKELHE